MLKAITYSLKQDADWKSKWNWIKYDVHEYFFEYIPLYWDLFIGFFKCFKDGHNFYCEPDIMGSDDEIYMYFCEHCKNHHCFDANKVYISNIVYYKEKNWFVRLKIRFAFYKNFRPLRSLWQVNKSEIN